MSRASIAVLIAAMIALTTMGLRAETYLDRESAAENPDFQVQGEYAGTFAGENDRATVGLQVAARGDGHFTALVYPGGLPGDGWNERDPLEGETSRDSAGEIVFTFGPYSAKFDEDAFEVIHSERGSVGRLESVQRESPTAGKQPPDGAVVLFDGSSVDAFRDGARMTEDGLLIEGAISRVEFEDARIHIEYRLPLMPMADGQHRANSGAYVQNRYEVQILESFGELPSINGHASLYNEREPDLNMSYPPLQWQTLDIDFTAPRFDENGEKTANARFTVRHNGVVVHDDVELPHGTGAGQARGEGGPGPLHLQDHGDPVRFRNVWIVIDD